MFNEKPVFEPAFLDVYSVGFMDSSGNPVYLEFYMELKNYTINFSKIFNWSYLDSSGRPVSGLEYLSELKYPVYFGVESNFGAKVVEQKLHWHDIDAEPSDYLPIPETIPHDPYPLFAEITIAGEHENIEINDKSIYIITIE